MHAEAFRALVDHYRHEAADLADEADAPLHPRPRRLLAPRQLRGPPPRFLWYRCDPCGVEELVAMSCKQRVLCPRCTGRSMSQTALRLADDVIADRPVRQWVFSLPHPLHQILAWAPDLLRTVVGICFRAVQRGLRQQRRWSARQGDAAPPAP